MTQAFCNSFARRVSLCGFLAICGCVASIQARGQGPPSPGSTAPTTAPPATTPPPATSSASCPAAYGVYSPIAGAPASPGAGASTSSTSTPTISVQQTNGTGGSTPAGGATSKTGSGDNSGSLHSGIIKLTAAQSDQITAFDVATALSGKITGVTLVPVGPSSLLYTVDPTKIGTSKSQPYLRDSVSVIATVKTGPNDTTGTPVSRTIPIVIRPSGTILLPGAGEIIDQHPSAGPGKYEITPIELPDAKANAKYQATLTVYGAPAGATITWQLGSNAPSWLSFDKASVDKASAVISGPAPDLPTKIETHEIEDQLATLISKLPAVSKTLEVIKLPDGFGHACDIITAIGHQIPNVISMSVIDDSRFLAGIAEIPGEPDSVAQTATNLRELAKELAVSSVPPSPKVTSVLTQLYYNRDAQSVATAIVQSFGQLKVSPVLSSASSSYADSLILADPTGNTGNDDNDPLTQARRMIALIDQPRPQITVNAWSLQVSSQNQGKMRQLVPEARRFAAGYNDALERSITSAWIYLNTKVARGEGPHPGIPYLNSAFAEYLCAIAEQHDDDGGNGAFQQDPMGKCPRGAPLSYSLGYTDIFDRESPNLVQLMLLMMATNDPLGEATNTLDRMEDVNSGDCPRRGEVANAAISSRSSYCKDAFPRLDSCQEADTYLYGLQVKNSKPDLDVVVSEDGSDVKGDSDATFDKLHTRQPPLFGAFECTRDRLVGLLSPNTEVGDTPIPSYIGLFRAAVADFLFQNKMKAEYPNDFAPYLYPASAAKLDSALTPIIEAFNEDMQAMQQYLQNQLTTGLPRDKHFAYTSNGLITVSVLSGSQASVQTQSLNYFPQNPTMSLENFAAQLAAATGGNSQTGSSTPVPMLAGTLSSVVNAVAAYNAAKPDQVTAKVGSGLSMSVTPYALSSDSGAELNVNVTYNENAAATISADSAQNQANDDLNSRVSEHEVSTLVRMDALKFFEISTMQSVIAREKAPYKLIDPIIELPLLDGLGVFPNWRRKPDVIYNQSVIFLQASILPTAADLGNSIRMQYDRLFPYCPDDQGCFSPYKEARAESDFNERSSRCNCDSGKLPGHDQFQAERLNELDRIMEYHRMMIRYFSGAPGNGLCSAISATSTGERPNCMPSWKEILPIAGETVSNLPYEVPPLISSKR
jgi:hypothetical protein